MDRVAQWLRHYGSIWVSIATKTRFWCHNARIVRKFPLTKEVDIFQQNIADSASIAAENKPLESLAVGKSLF